ncbi:uncharacterized protein FOMMEDRAFT_171191 [Fomitiporia mediterranea MF3/22]|uniref:uncharacterized protein n=1 Tax=Fomitiporia mediterranea (strain MF3/22) TaxID=694068 RepID=UPI00044079DA|nr:uncharacterized protein FOMMEDRAFT_171191 [Fomitiporia mediterranea MF3/22]EJC98260.1 hypothetical protein FOMMEDRAFT_171191 [Fomitiporia mediterranea MF3/22]
MKSNPTTSMGYKKSANYHVREDSNFDRVSLALSVARTIPAAAFAGYSHIPRLGEITFLEMIFHKDRQLVLLQQMATSPFHGIRPASNKYRNADSTPDEEGPRRGMTLTLTRVKTQHFRRGPSAIPSSPSHQCLPY